MEEREDPGEPEGPAEQTFTWPLLGALYGSLVLVAIVALLASNPGAASRTRWTRRPERSWRRPS